MIQYWNILLVNYFIAYTETILETLFIQKSNTLPLTEFYYIPA